jgi:hypothetical protein
LKNLTCWQIEDRRFVIVVLSLCDAAINREQGLYDVFHYSMYKAVMGVSEITVNFTFIPKCDLAEDESAHRA